jgi:branched-chain amino acid transport system substrate-binding protein
MEAALRGLEQVGGDLSGGGRRFMAALGMLRFDGPTGPVRLNGHRQAISTTYLLRVERLASGSFTLRTIRAIRNVDDSSAGRFGPTKPLPSRVYPPCRRGNPPPWVR